MSFAYSIKARGINRDIFGHTEYYMEPMDSDVSAVVNKITAMQDKGVDVSVLFREGYDLEHFYGGKNKVAFSLSCYKQLRKIRPEGIYTQAGWFCPLPGVIYKKLHGCTLIYTFHTEPIQGVVSPG